MSVNMVPEDHLREALRPRQVDPYTFEAAVRSRVIDYANRGNDPFANLSPALRSAAAFLPLEVITAGQMKGAAARLAPTTGVYKLLAYLTFPAISLFVLLGATVFSIAKIRRIRGEDGRAPIDEAALRQHKAMVARPPVGWVARFRGNRRHGMDRGDLATLPGLHRFFRDPALRSGQLRKNRSGKSSRDWPILFDGIDLSRQVPLGYSWIGDQEIHIVDQALILPVFFFGVFILALITGGIKTGVFSRAAQLNKKTTQVVTIGLLAVLVLPLSVWYLNPILWPATPARIKAYVESFDNAPFSTASWQQWEIVARWAVESKLDPDLSSPRRLLAAEMAGKQNPFILSMRVQGGTRASRSTEPAKGL